MDQIIPTIIHLFETRGQEAYGSESVNQLEHALQCGTMAVEAQSNPSLIVAALLHDIGHILSEDKLPEDDLTNLDDRHEKRAHPWLLEHFGAAVADPVRLHVTAKRYLCTIEPEYAASLSPASLKSFHDQGGSMSNEERVNFESETYFREALTLRRWDDLAKIQGLETPSIHYFATYLTQLLRA